MAETSNKGVVLTADTEFCVSSVWLVEWIVKRIYTSLGCLTRDVILMANRLRDTADADDDVSDSDTKRMFEHYIRLLVTSLKPRSRRLFAADNDIFLMYTLDALINHRGELQSRLHLSHKTCIDAATELTHFVQVSLMPKPTIPMWRLHQQSMDLFVRQPRRPLATDHSQWCYCCNTLRLLQPTRTMTLANRCRLRLTYYLGQKQIHTLNAERWHELLSADEIIVVSASRHIPAVCAFYDIQPSQLLMDMTDMMVDVPM
jgi:hypothetical protein